MNIRLSVGQVDVLSGFLSNMAVAWFIAAFIGPPTVQSVFMYCAYGFFSLYAAMYLKGRIYEF